MIFSNKQITLILFVSLVVLTIACIYLGYSSTTEGFDTSTAPNTTEPNSITSSTAPNATEPNSITSSTAPNTTAPNTTLPYSMASSTTSGMTTLENSSNITPASSLTVGTTMSTISSSISTNPLTTNTIITKPKLMNNGFKIPQTNLMQSNFNGTSNIYSPYLYVREPFQPMSYDMNNYQHI